MLFNPGFVWTSLGLDLDRWTQPSHMFVVMISMSELNPAWNPRKNIPMDVQIRKEIAAAKSKSFLLIEVLNMKWYVRSSWWTIGMAMSVIILCSFLLFGMSPGSWTCSRSITTSSMFGLNLGSTAKQWSATLTHLLGLIQWIVLAFVKLLRATWTTKIDSIFAHTRWTLFYSEVDFGTKTAVEVRNRSKGNLALRYRNGEVSFSNKKPRWKKRIRTGLLRMGFAWSTCLRPNFFVLCRSLKKQNWRPNILGRLLPIKGQIQ